MSDVTRQALEWIATYKDEISPQLQASSNVIGRALEAIVNSFRKTTTEVNDLDKLVVESLEYSHDMITKISDQALQASDTTTWAFSQGLRGLERDVSILQTLGQAGKEELFTLQKSFLEAQGGADQFRASLTRIGLMDPEQLTRSALAMSAMFGTTLVPTFSDALRDAIVVAGPKVFNSLYENIAGPLPKVLEEAFKEGSLSIKQLMVDMLLDPQAHLPEMSKTAESKGLDSALQASAVAKDGKKSGIILGVLAHFGMQFTSITAALKGLLLTAGPLVLLFEILKDAFMPIIRIMNQLITIMARPLQDMFLKMFEAFMPLFNLLIDTIASLAEQLTPALVTLATLISKILTPAVKLFAWALSQIISLIDLIVQGIEFLFNWFETSSIGKKIMKIFDYVGEGLEDLLGTTAARREVTGGQLPDVLGELGLTPIIVPPGAVGGEYPKPPIPEPAPEPESVALTPEQEARRDRRRSATVEEMRAAHALPYQQITPDKAFLKEALDALKSLVTVSMHQSEWLENESGLSPGANDNIPPWLRDHAEGSTLA